MYQVDPVFNTDKGAQEPETDGAGQVPPSYPSGFPTRAEITEHARDVAGEHESSICRGYD